MTMTTSAAESVVEQDDLSDLRRLKNAFMEFRALGYWARIEQRDGMRAVPDDVLKRGGKFVLYDERETGAFDPGGNLRRDLHLHHFTKDSEEIIRLLRQYGLNAQIDPHGRVEGLVIIKPQAVSA